MAIDVLSLFPGMFTSVLGESIVAQAQKAGALQVRLTDIRDFAGGRHRQADDYPFGGGAGMVMKPEPVCDAIDWLRQDDESAKAAPVVYFTPQGRLLTQSIVNEYARLPHVILLCGHYKELDQRVRDHMVDDELSVGDYVLSGGELPAMLFIDAVARLQPGVLSDIESALSDSHQQRALGCPHYTRPAEYRGWQAPEVLLGGNHAAIEAWRRERALELTRRVRPDLLDE
ncbi:MAG: tRNA (guanosine(37)-N1)-methyltransferase TrmD [Candidatus Cloacimonetes bacterium]|nr:tRNA (guanosine(37)-N1)-methyltransferase TrmD [Candidatus Cloacimonadota bacterium]